MEQGRSDTKQYAVLLEEKHLIESVSLFSSKRNEIMVCSLPFTVHLISEHIFLRARLKPVYSL